MQVVYLMSNPSLAKIDVSPLHVAFVDFVSDPVYREEYVRRASCGEPVYQFGAPVDPMFEGGVARSFSELDSLGDCVRGVIVDTLADYVRASSLPEVDIVAVGGSGATRVRLIKTVADSGSFSEKDHWLWGVSNPAELAVYSWLLSGFVRSRIRVAVCESCFQYSMYGARFSPYTGILEPIPTEDDGMLGMSAWVNYRPSREQCRVFYENHESVSRFSQGFSAPEYDRSIQSALGVTDETKEGVL